MPTGTENLADYEVRAGDIISDSTLDATAKVRALRDLREDVKFNLKGQPNGSEWERKALHLIGTIESYIGDQELRREAEAMQHVFLAAAARETAEVREDLLTAGESADGLPSHEDLDRDRYGLMESTIGAFGAALDSGLLRRLALKRRRSSGGQFADEFGTPPPLKARGGAAIPGTKPKQKQPAAPPVPDVHEQYRAEKRAETDDMRRKLIAAAQKILLSPAATAEADVMFMVNLVRDLESRGFESQGGVSPDLYEEGKALAEKLREAIGKKQMKRRERHRAPQAPVKQGEQLAAINAMRNADPQGRDFEQRLALVRKWGLDDWPEKGEIASKLFGDAKDSQDFHMITLPQSPGTEGQEPRKAYTKQRRKVHDAAVGHFLAEAISEVLGDDHPIVSKLSEGGRLTPEEKDVVRAAATEARGGEAPFALFLAGGPASGKTTALNTTPELQKAGSVLVNPDEMKERLPEYAEMVEGGDRFAASGVHEESSDMAKRLHSEALDLGLNVTIDGTGDSKPGKFAGKMKAMDEAGYDVSVMYVTLPTDEAVIRATVRAMQSGRWVPEPELRSQHKNVSANFEEVSALPFLKDLRVIDNAGEEPKLIAAGRQGSWSADDSEAMDAFLAKANEEWIQPAHSGGGKGLAGIDDAFIERLLAENPREEGEEVFNYQARIVASLPPEAKHEIIFRLRERYEPVDFVVEGMKRWWDEKGLPHPQADILEVPASIEKAEAVADAFEGLDDMADDPAVVAAFDDFKRQNEEMYDFITRPETDGGLGITVTIGSPDEEAYSSAEEQAEDVRVNRHFKIQSGLGGEHSLMSTEEYDRFRVVHDIFGHVGIGGGFDRHGEYEAWLAHMSMYTGEGQKAMSSEYHGVNSSMWAGNAAGTGQSKILPDELIVSPWNEDGTLREDHGVVKTKAAPPRVEQQSPGTEATADPVADMAEVDAGAFHTAIQPALSDPDHIGFLTDYPPEEYAKMRTFVAADGKVGAALKPDGEIASVFNLGGPKGSGRALIKRLVAEGGRWLECFGVDPEKGGKGLPDVYASIGFEEAERSPWNDDYAPEGWDYDRFGRPPFMRMNLRANIVDAIDQGEDPQWSS